MKMRFKKFFVAIMAVAALIAFTACVFDRGHLAVINRHQELMDVHFAERVLFATQAQSEIQALRRIVTASVMYAPNANIFELDLLRVGAENAYFTAIRALENYEFSIATEPR